MDIEGSERHVVTDMLFNARFQYVNSIMVDSTERLGYLHSYKNRYIPVKIRHYTRNCSILVKSAKRNNTWSDDKIIKVLFKYHR